MSDTGPQSGSPTPRQPTIASYALGLLIGCCLCASLIASLV